MGSNMAFFYRETLRHTCINVSTSSSLEGKSSDRSYRRSRKHRQGSRQRSVDTSSTSLRHLQRPPRRSRSPRHRSISSHSSTSSRRALSHRRSRSIRRSHSPYRRSCSHSPRRSHSCTKSRSPPRLRSRTRSRSRTKPRSRTRSRLRQRSRWRSRSPRRSNSCSKVSAEKVPPKIDSAITEKDINEIGEGGNEPAELSLSEEVLKMIEKRIY